MVYYEHVCGLYFIGQVFTNETGNVLPELRYTFPVYEGVSVVGFTCTINQDRVIRGVVKERGQARKKYDDAVRAGETAGLLEQLPSAADVFTTSVGNVPAGAELRVELVYLGELKQDTEVDGVRFTIPTSIAPRYGDYPGQMAKGSNVNVNGGIKIVVDAQVPSGSNIQNIQSPTHPISVTIGNTSSGAATGAEMSLQKASASLALEAAELGKDFVLQVAATNLGEPVALLETHPTIANHRALMTTLVPKFNLPSIKPEIVFICDRSGSMGSGLQIPNLKKAVGVFLKSLPLGVKFNVCSFGSRCEFLFKNRSRTYDSASLEEAMTYVSKFSANFGGTEMQKPISEAFENRYGDIPLELFLLTDGEIWDQQGLFSLVENYVAKTNGGVRLFTLGIGNSVSHSLIEGVARSGNGFSQTVGENENMNTKVVRMLKAALSPHVQDYTLEVKYDTTDLVHPSNDDDDDDDIDEFVVVEKVMDALSIDVADPTATTTAAQLTAKNEAAKKPISLYDPSADPDVEMANSSPERDTLGGGKYSGLPVLPEPKLLQTPFRIPTLYPFVRTNVYLLLSPESAQKTPKSVVLRATSDHGPLELEIPVTIVEEKGQTIHQLAARAATRELEEGRGWIFHAKDSADGKLLKEKYPSRFDDMVEREGVRLGVQFQVGSKWCSFVAVERKGEQDNDQMEEHEAGVVKQHTPATRGPPVFAAAQAQPRYFRQMSQMSRASPMAFQHQQLSQSSMAFRRQARSDNFRGRAAQPRAQASPPSQPAAPPSFLSKQSGSSSFELAEEDGESEDSPEDASLSFIGGSLPSLKEKKRKIGGGPLSRHTSILELPDQAFATLVSLQSFEGFWKWEDNLFAALSVDRSLLLSYAGRALGAGGDAVPSDALATGFVLAFVETEMADRKEEWEMMADKAQHWLDANLRGGGMKGADYVAALRGVVHLVRSQA